jgi:hypothetical protein
LVKNVFHVPKGPGVQVKHRYTAFLETFVEILLGDGEGNDQVGFLADGPSHGHGEPILGFLTVGLKGKFLVVFFQGRDLLGKTHVIQDVRDGLSEGKNMLGFAWNHKSECRG